MTCHVAKPYLVSPLETGRRDDEPAAREGLECGSTGGADVAEAVGKIKSEPGPDCQVHGSGMLIQTLLANDLALHRPAVSPQHESGSSTATNASKSLF